jgi:uncharacterized protein YdhG (YjbR/CyaY superfamily)
MRRRTQGNSRSRPEASDVDGYLAALPGDVRAMLEKLRRTIKTAAPKAKEDIRYKIPAYEYHGPLVFFAAYRDHCSFFGGKSILKTFRKELKPFQISGTTIHFTVDNPLPTSLVRRMVKVRMAEREARARHKQGAYS